MSLSVARCWQPVQPDLRRKRGDSSSSAYLASIGNNGGQRIGAISYQPLAKLAWRNLAA
jgi:hypothetical protein